MLRLCLVGVTSTVIGVAACSSDSNVAALGGGGEAGMDAGAGGVAGSGASAGSSAQAAGEATGGVAGGGLSEGGAAGAPSPQAGTNAGGNGGLGGDSSGEGGSGGDNGCHPSASPGGAGAGGANGESQVLYTNDFETPNMALVASCGNSLDPVGINVLYGTSGFVFQQVNTVEGVVVHDPGALYSDPSGTAKNYALGMLSSYQDDQLALTFDVTGKSFLNVGFDLSAIDVNGCGGPFGTAVPVMQVRLYDTPSGTFSFGAPGTLLDEGDVTGVAAPTAWTFAWQYGVVSLDATAVSGSALTVVFDLKQSGYGAFDNLSIVAADSAGVVDRNNDGIPDDQQCL